METVEKNIAHVQALIDEAKAAGLDGAGWVSSLGAVRCCEGYNGIGPEFLPAKIRAKVTAYLSTFEAAALIHDMRNDVADGTRESFLAANDEFRINCILLADHRYAKPRQGLRRYRARAVAQILYDFVSADSFGWKAWLEAHERYLSRQGLRPSTPSERC